MNRARVWSVLGLCVAGLFCSLGGGCIRGFVVRDLAWYKGNTHTHTVLCGHADTTPEEVAAWYLARDHNFLILSEHNQFIDPATVKLPADRRSDFILIPGEEVGRKNIHSTAMNIEAVVDGAFDVESKTQTIQNQVDETIKQGGVTILNHPNFGWALTAVDIWPVERLYMFELYNGHPSVRNEGDHEHDSTEEMWDKLLTSGMKIYGVSSDDAHNFQKWGTNVSNPGRGWVMVRAHELTAEAITEAMVIGEFYASSGVMLESVWFDGKYYKVDVDLEATGRELESELLVGRRVEEGESGWLIEAISNGGNVVGETGTLATQGAVGAAFDIDLAEGYLRLRVTYTRPHPDGGYERFFAWVQPVFLDGR